MAQTGNVFAHRHFVGAEGLARARAVRSPRCRRLVVSNAVATQTTRRTTKKEALKDARDDVRELIKSKHCNPILVRVAWHDSGTYDKVGCRRDSQSKSSPVELDGCDANSAPVYLSCRTLLSFHSAGALMAVSGSTQRSHMQQMQVYMPATQVAMLYKYLVVQGPDILQLQAQQQQQHQLSE